MQTPNGIPQRHNLRELKDELLSALGAGVSKEYWSLLSNFLNYKLTKKEFDGLILKTVSRDHLRRHNHFIRAIFRNAVCSEAPHSPCAPAGGPLKKIPGLPHTFAAADRPAPSNGSPVSGRLQFPARSKEKVANGFPDNHVNVIATPPRGKRTDNKRKVKDAGLVENAGVVRLSEKENDAVASEGYERSPENRLPKRTKFAELKPPAPNALTSGVAAAAGTGAEGLPARDGRPQSEDVGDMVMARGGPGREGEDMATLMAMDEGEDNVQGVAGREALDEDDEDGDMDGTVWLREPVRPPIGLPFCLQSPGGSSRPQWSERAGSYPVTHSLLGKPLAMSYEEESDGDDARNLPDHEEVERRASNIARTECGLQGVSKEAVVVIREGMEHYLKRILQGCLEIVKSRRKRRNGSEVQERDGVQGDSWQHANGCHSPPRITVQDLMTATDFHPHLLGEEAPIHREWIQLLL